MENINASDEQDNVIKILENGFNCFVDAVPGSGKSTLSYIIANKFNNKNILSLTYSANLKREARIKIEQFGIKNLKIHSVNNLYVNGSSNFVTGGSTHPTFTIVQMALKLSDHIIKEMHF